MWEVLASFAGFFLCHGFLSFTFFSGARRGLWDWLGGRLVGRWIGLDRAWVVGGEGGMVVYVWKMEGMVSSVVARRGGGRGGEGGLSWLI